MPWCPNCKDEYKEGITTCADCGCELVNDLSLVETKDDIEEDTFTYEEAELAEAYEDLEEIMELQEEETQVYVNNEEKAEENRTSAYTLLIVGSIGFIGVVLYMLGVFGTGMSKNSKYMITGVMGSLFILFIIMGVVSLRNFRIFKKRAYSENNLTAEITKWSLTNLKKDEIDEKLSLGDMLEEAKYFERTKYIKASIRSQFMNLDESYLNRLTDEIYPSIFEE